MNDPMSNGTDFRVTNRAFEPTDKQADHCRLIRGLNPTFLGATAVCMVHDPSGILLPDSVDLTG
jgi:hypothetical protein